MGLPMSMEQFEVFFHTLTWDSPCQWIPSKQFSCSRPANCRLIRSSVGSAIWQRAPRNSPGKFICYDNVRANKLPLTLSSNSAPSAFRRSAAVRQHINLRSTLMVARQRWRDCRFKVRRRQRWKDCRFKVRRLRWRRWKDCRFKV